MAIAAILLLFSASTFILFRVHRKKAAGSRRHIAGLLRIVNVNVAVMAFLIYASVYYHADGTALAAMKSDEVVSVKKTDTGWMFDGPSQEDVLIFYPGAKVEETAYAPLLRLIAQEEMDVFLVKMPLRLAFFGMNKAEEILEDAQYSRYYIGGHSLGGAMAATYAAEHERELSGLILFAAYPTKETSLDTILLYGSGDEVLNREKVSRADDLVSGRYEEIVIDGGNHAWFGNYGAQRGDGEADITAQEQQSRTVEEIRAFVSEAEDTGAAVSTTERVGKDYE